jgi:hypothetical protein
MQTVARPKVSQEGIRHEDFILNVDQTPIPFTFHARKTINTPGSRTVHIRKSTCDTRRATYAVTVTASGKLLKPLVIFKGKPTGRIVNREFPSFEQDMIYVCQKSAWMDERVMLLWVDTVLAPYVATRPDGVIPIIFLDSYRCHMMQSVVQKIQDIGVEVEHIPGGCTCLCQPVDVGVNKPLKNRIRNLWEAWMIQDGMQQDGTAKPPLRRDIVGWIRSANSTIPEQMIRNAWRNNPYSWFP